MMHSIRSFHADVHIHLLAKLFFCFLGAPSRTFLRYFDFFYVRTNIKMFFFLMIVPNKTVKVLLICKTTLINLMSGENERK